MNETDDRQLVIAAQAGNHRAFEQLVSRYLRQVRAFVALRAPVAHLVDGIAHETFVHAIHHLADFEAGTSLRAWVRAIAFQKLRSEIQSGTREPASQHLFAGQVAVDEELAVPPVDRFDH